MIEGATRYNDKRLQELAELIDPKVQELADAYEDDKRNLMIELCKVGKKEIPVVSAAPVPPMKSSQVILTKEIKERLPKLYSQESKKPEEVKVVVKFFDPTGSWTWYVTEGDPTGEKITEGNFRGEDDYRFFGYVKGFEGELGYFSLGELSTAKSGVKGIATLPIERDIRFGFNTTLAEVMVEKEVLA